MLVCCSRQTQGEEGEGSKRAEGQRRRPLARCVCRHLCDSSRSPLLLLVSAASDDGLFPIRARQARKSQSGVGVSKHTARRQMQLVVAAGAQLTSLCAASCFSEKPSGADVSKRLGEMWKEIDEDEKAKYEKQAAKDSQDTERQRQASAADNRRRDETLTLDSLFVTLAPQSSSGRMRCASTSRAGSRRRERAAVARRRPLRRVSLRAATAGDRTPATRRLFDLRRRRTDQSVSHTQSTRVILSSTLRLCSLRSPVRLSLRQHRSRQVRRGRQSQGTRQGARSSEEGEV